MHEGHADTVTRQVRSRHELEAGLMLVHNNYVECGYMEPHPSGIRLGVHYALPTTRTYVALLGSEIIATISLFIDSGLGLPLDAVFPDTAAALRKAGRKISEVGMLADRRRTLSRGVDILLRLMRHVFHDARTEGIDEMLITVNPKHVSFYERLLTFRRIGPERSYGSVGDAPAVPLTLGVSGVQEEDAPNERIRSIFFSPLAPEEEGPGYHMCREDLAYFFLEKTDMLLRLTPAQRKVIQGFYPALSLRQMMEAAAPWPTGNDRELAARSGRGL